MVNFIYYIYIGNIYSFFFVHAVTETSIVFNMMFNKTREENEHLKRRKWKKEAFKG